MEIEINAERPVIIDAIMPSNVLLELLAEAKRNLAKADAEPFTVISHEELKRLLLEKRIR